MKRLDRYILEKFQINKDSKPVYSCHPKTWTELRKILEERLAKDKDADLNDIDVSAIKYMGTHNTRGLFEGLDPHNIHIEFWDMSNAINTNAMFWKCENFNCNLNNWDISKVTNMVSMFNGCSNFNSDLGKWDVHKVKNMRCMFWDCEKFEGEGLEKWKPISCDYMGMGDMFYRCTALKNKPNWYQEK